MFWFRLAGATRSTSASRQTPRRKLQSTFFRACSRAVGWLAARTATSFVALRRRNIFGPSPLRVAGRLAQLRAVYPSRRAIVQLMACSRVAILASRAVVLLWQRLAPSNAERLLGRGRWAGFYVSLAHRPNSSTSQQSVQRTPTLGRAIDRNGAAAVSVVVSAVAPSYPHTTEWITA